MTGQIPTLPPLEFYEVTEDNPGGLNNMYGSLFGVAGTKPEVKQTLTKHWYSIVRRWYPNLHQKVYCAPPLHFNAVAYKPKPDKPKVLQEHYERYGMRLYVPSQYSSTKSDESQQRVLGALSAFFRRRKAVGFILSNMEFQNYLNKSYEFADPDTPDMPKPNIKLQNEEGDIDVLVIDKVYGIFVLEVKAIGDEDEIWDSTTQTDKGKFSELHSRLKKKIATQVKKGRCVIKKLLSDLSETHTINVRGGFMLVNVRRQFFEEALDAFDKDDPDSMLDVLERLEVPDKKSLCDVAFFRDDLPPKYTPGEEVITDEIFERMTRVWNNMVAMHGKKDSEPLSDELYEQIVARFCGPLTTVKIYTEKTYPRVKLHLIPKPKKGKKGKGKQEATVRMVPDEAITRAGAARIMARRFSELVLLREQIEILQKNEEFVHLEGPPGTGKTLLLLLRILTWLDDGHMVWVISLSPPSRSVTHVLMEQVKKMVEQNNTPEKAEKILDRLRMFMMIRAENTLDEEYFKRRLLKFCLRAKHNPTPAECGYPRPPLLPPKSPPHDCKVCLAVDETGLAGKGLIDFFRWVTKLHKEKAFRGPRFNEGLSIWSASVERIGRPNYVTEPGKTTEEKFGVRYELTMPLRCPPSVQRALILVQPSLDQENICCFTEEMTLSHPGRKKGAHDREVYAADGLPVFLIGHGSHKDPTKDIWSCYECGDELADYLQNVLHIGEEECDCPEKPIIYEKIEVKNCPDCKKLTKGSLPAGDLPLKYNDVMIVATQRAFQFSVPIGKFALAMAKRNLKVAINTTREEGKDPVPENDVILIVDVTSVHGLERAIIVIIPEVNPPKPLPARYRGILYPEPPIMPEEALPEQVKDAIASEEKRGKDSITFAADGKVEDDIPDDAKDIPSDFSTQNKDGLNPDPEKDSLRRDPEQEIQEHIKQGASIDPVFVKHNPWIRAAIDKEQCLTMTGSGNVEIEAKDKEMEEIKAEDKEMEEEQTSMDESSGEPAPASAQDEEMRDLPHGSAGATHALSESGDALATQDTEMQDTQPGDEAANNQCSDSSERKIPYTYNDHFSKQEITAALESLSPQSRQDVFYIGSRAVCQMILVHLGKSSPKLCTQNSDGESMQTD